LGAYTRLGRQRLDRGETNMADLARSAFQELTESSGARAPALEVGDLPPAVADRAMIRMLFTQLLDNALKFTRGNPAARIAVTGVAEGGWNTYCVSDDGVGFDPRYGHKLFAIFQRLHRRDDFEGSGVGLALVHRIVQRHGGVTRAEGDVDRGARIYFTLPGSPKNTV
jgi:two-component system sensor kinase